MRMRRAVLLFGAVASLLQGSTGSEGAQPQAQNADVWRPIRFMLGTWDTTSSGQPGNGTGTREYRLVLGDGFIECRTRVTYPPQDKNPKGEIHEDIGLISYDRTRKAFVLRQFHKEGFVNTTSPRRITRVCSRQKRSRTSLAGFVRARRTAKPRRPNSSRFSSLPSRGKTLRSTPRRA